jgi:sigma-B regulation protein RsbU (phosphoserine phosphatase)
VDNSVHDLAMEIPRILVADDQTDILQALRLLLSDAGFQTELVNSIDGVMDRVAAGPYDLLLMDLNYTRDTTSGREGLELLERVRTHDRTLPIVVMTGWGSIETAVEAMRRGARSFVQKPWDDTTLLEVVKREVEEGIATRRLDARLAREQEDARMIQSALLPSVMPVIEGAEVAARWSPASGIGGDCYDLLRFSPTRLALSIADVVGKGLPAALLMSNLQASVRAFATSGADPQDVVTRVNQLLCRNITTGKFVTFCYAVVDTAGRHVTYANAGHNPPLLMRRDGRVLRLEPTGLVLGVASDWTYEMGRHPLEPGDRLVCFTDGITEAQSPDTEEFGEARLVATLSANRHRTPEELTAILGDAAAAWAGGVTQDDATLIVLAIT